MEAELLYVDLAGLELALVVKVSLELRAPPVTASPVLELKAGTLGLSLLTKHFVLFFVMTGSGMPLCFLQSC